MPRIRDPALLTPRFLPGILLAAWTACASPYDLRHEVDDLQVAWRDSFPEGSLETVVEGVRALGRVSQEHPEALAAVPLLARLVLDCPSALVRAEALRAAWRLAGVVPEEPLGNGEDLLSPAEFNARTQRFEVLMREAGPEAFDELLELATFMGRYRFPVDEPGFAVDLADVVMSRATWSQPGPLQDVFRVHAPASVRHALTVVTLRAANDPYPFVRQEALAAAVHLHPETALTLIEGMLLVETDSLVVLAGLTSLEQHALQGAIAPRDVLRVLALVGPAVDVAVRRRSEALRAEVSA